MKQESFKENDLEQVENVKREEETRMRVERARDVLGQIKREQYEAEKNRVVREKDPSLMNVEISDPKFIESLIERLARASETLESYAKSAKNEMVENPDDYEKNARLYLDVLAEKTNKGLRVSFHFYSTDRDGERKSISPYEWSMTHDAKEGTQLSQYDVLYARSLARGIKKIAERLGVTAWITEELE